MGVHEAAEGKHICDYCEEILSECSGGTATCSEKAVCTICNTPYGEKNVNNHNNLKKTEAKDATVDTEGNKEYWSCDECEKYFLDSDAKTETTLSEIRIEKLKPEYTIVSGDKQKWNGVGEVTFKVDGDFAKFVGLKMGDKDIDKANYDAKEGSTIVTLKADYLKTLSVGEYVITVIYTDGSVDVTFTVEEQPVIPDVPPTGDKNNMLMWTILLMLSVCEAAGVVIYNNKKKIKR